jgi:hypothetical protein
LTLPDRGEEDRDPEEEPREPEETEPFDPEDAVFPLDMELPEEDPCDDDLSPWMYL